MSIKLSIIIINFNTSALTLACLESIQKFPPKVPFEVIVVDNGSEEKIEDSIASRFPKVRFIETGMNQGFSKANNLGIFNAHGEYLLILNSDTKFSDSLLDAMVHQMDSHPEIGALGPRHVDGEGKFQLSCGRFPGLVSELIRKLAHYRLSLNDTWVRDYLDNQHSQSSNIDWLSGSCLLLRRKALEQSGLFDERFFMYFEDIDLCRRIQLAGWKNHYLADEGEVVHYGGQSAKQNLMRVYIEYRLSQIYFTRKYHGVIGSLGVRVFLIVKYGFHGLKWAMVYLLRRLARKKARKAYTMLLLAKKVVFLSLSSIPESPSIPRLSV